MSSAKPHPTGIPPELDAEMTPAVRAFVESLLTRISELEARIAELERGRKTPQNSSLPPSTQHPHAKPPPRKQKAKKKRGGQSGHPCCAALTVKMQTQVTADETGTKQQNGKAWLWTFVARMFTVFAVRATRAATAVDQGLTTAFEGIVTCDRAKVDWRAGRLQWCWAHLKRDVQALIDRGDHQAKRLGYDLRRMTGKLFDHWGNYRDGPIRRAALVRRMAPVRREVERLLLRGIASGNPSLVGMGQEWYEHRE